MSIVLYLLYLTYAVISIVFIAYQNNVIKKANRNNWMLEMDNNLIREYRKADYAEIQHLESIIEKKELAQPKRKPARPPKNAK